MLEQVPSPLGEGFSQRFFSLPDEERAQIITSLAKVASFTKGENLDEIAQMVNMITSK